jgi:glycosyltransferase involved in cell wall biosynthesis
MLAGHDVKIATEAHEIVPELLNIWTQPLIYRDADHLIDQLPESDIVVATFWVTAHKYLPEIRRRYGCATAYYVQDYEPLFYPETEVDIRRDAAASYDLSEHFVFASQWIADQVGPREGTGEVVPLDVDLDVFYDRRTRRQDRLRVVSVAEPGFEKRRRGFIETADAFRRIHEARPDVELVFFGADDSAMPELPFPYANAGRLYNQNDVARLVASAHVLVDASEWQGFGRPALEAMACGTVPVMTGVGGLFEYARDGENCLLTPSNDPELIAAAVLRLLDDEALWNRLSSNGRPSAEPLSHRIIGARHLELYTRWVNENRARRAAAQGGRA